MFFAKTILLAAAVATSQLASAPAAGVERIPEPPRPATSPTLQRVVRQLVRDGAPGALAVARSPSGIQRAQAGLARRRPRIAMAATDRFRVASITKTFVATVVLQLVADGKLGLDDPLERWLPGLVQNGGAITIRELLDHTSGLFDYLQDAGLARAVVAHPGRVWQPRELVAIATSHAPLFPPGGGWSYSNTNYILLGLVVEAAGGATVEEQLQQRVFQPLSFTATSFPSGTRIEGAHADGYVGFATVPRLRSLVDTSIVSPALAWAAGGIVSSGDDVTSFYAALLGGRLLPPSLLAAMKTPVPGVHYGFGLLQVDTRCGRAYGHEGDLLGYRTIVYTSPDGARVALVMVNVDRTYVSQGELEQAAETVFCRGMKRTTFRQPEARTRSSVSGA
jgi:D-alanyl-D-alanine carboxypeptidase